jgi:hypothetical protein
MCNLHFSGRDLSKQALFKRDHERRGKKVTAVFSVFSKIS